MLLGRVLAFTGRASLPAMLAFAAVGAVVWDSAGYELGRRFSEPMRASRAGQRIGPERRDDTEQYVRRRGGRAVFLGRFVGVLRAKVPFVAGAGRMPYRSFLPSNAPGAVIWAPGFVYHGPGGDRRGRSGPGAARASACPASPDPGSSSARRSRSHARVNSTLAATSVGQCMPR